MIQTAKAKAVTEEGIDLRVQSGVVDVVHNPDDFKQVSLSPSFEVILSFTLYHKVWPGRNAPNCRREQVVRLPHSYLLDESLYQSCVVNPETFAAELRML